LASSSLSSASAFSTRLLYQVSAAKTATQSKQNPMQNPMFCSGLMFMMSKLEVVALDSAAALCAIVCRRNSNASGNSILAMAIIVRFKYDVAVFNALLLVAERQLEAASFHSPFFGIIIIIGGATAARREKTKARRRTRRAMQFAATRGRYFAAVFSSLQRAAFAGSGRKTRQM
jgi:hypothetical protein